MSWHKIDDICTASKFMAIIYGEGNAGKTYQCSTFPTKETGYIYPKPIKGDKLSTGLITLKGQGLRGNSVSSVSELRDCIIEASKINGLKHLFIDCFTVMGEFFLKEIQANPQRSQEKGVYNAWKVYAEIKEDVSQFFNLLSVIPQNVIISCEQGPNLSSHLLGPNFPGNYTPNLLCYYPDHVFRLTSEDNITTGEREFAIQTFSTNTHFAKCKLPKGKSCEAYEYADLYLLMQKIRGMV